MSRRCFLIVNPTSGRFSEDRLRGVVDSIRRGGVEPEFLATMGPDDASAFARKICAEYDEPLVIAGGGDGTVNGVINGLALGRATLAVLPLGTSNVLARELGIASLDDAVARIVRGDTRPMSVGLLEGFGVRRYFMLMVGVGFDGAVVEGVRGGEKKLLHEVAYLLSALRTLAAWDGQVMDVTVGGERYSCHSVIVCNAARYGGRYLLAPGASLFEPGFEVVCVTAPTRTACLRLALNVVTGRGVRGKAASVFKGEEIEIGGNKQVQVDGDFVCHGPVKVRAVRNFVRVIV